MAHLLEQYAIDFMPSLCGPAAGSRRRAMEPAPDETLMIRGVLPYSFDFNKRGAKASTVRRTPVALVANEIAMPSDRLPPGQPMAALLTRASSLELIDQYQTCTL